MRERSLSICSALALGILICSSALPAAQRAGATDGDPARGAAATDVVATYCAGCHNGRVQAPDGRPLETLDPARIAEEPDLWARAYRQLRAGTMPPVGARRPDRATSDAALADIDRALDSAMARPAGAADDLAVATRLARLLWDASPDGPLLSDARASRLREDATLEGHVHRMLADDRVDAFVARFFVPWLWLDRLATADPDLAFFPAYTPSLRDALVMETKLFLLSQLREDRDPVDLWSADYTFLNEQLASHYGVDGVSGPQFRRVSSAPERAGLLGHGSVLMLTSRHQHGVDAAYTSPAYRARWVQEHFLGAALPRAFPGAEPVKPELPITPQTRTLPVQPCVTCHRNFFPLGYALERFDSIGRWRTHDQAGPVDTSGAFVDGTSTDGIIALRQVLLARPEAFRTTITEALLAYAGTGTIVRAGTPETLVEARRILGEQPEPRWSALIAAVVRTAPPDEHRD